jgi:hypothetical protein
MDVKKHTITTIFMAPTLGIPVGELGNNGFINAYVKDENGDVEYDIPVIYLLFAPKNINKFRKFLQSEYERDSSLIEDYDYGDGFVVAVYKLNTEYNNDFDLIRKGKYSKTSKEFQKLFPRVKKIIKNELHRDELSLQFRIFNKTPDMYEYWEEAFNVRFSEDMEVWRGYDENNEILTHKLIEEYVK